MTETIVTVVGARPQFVKAAVVSRALRALPAVREVLIHTGQHFDDNMSQVFFEELDIPPPAHNLGIAAHSHGAMTGRMLEAIERVVIDLKPAWVVVYGDTNSTLAGALAATKLQVKVAHVEAGLRSFNRHMPEEINRIVADHIADLLFAPTATAVANLAREGIEKSRVRLVGDVMYDSARFASARLDQALPRSLGLHAKGFVLATVHRQENTDDPARLRAIFEGLIAIAATMPVVVPLHPRTRAALAAHGLDTIARAKLRVIEPIGYFAMLALEQAARLVATDSGGVQKEAFFAGTPCVTLRNETEWVELVEIGVNRVVPPTDADRVAAGLRAALTEERTWPRAELYGGGRAGEAIARALAGER
jgi:UDP-GlcNAc3NAcA epimerase